MFRFKEYRVIFQKELYMRAQKISNGKRITIDVLRRAFWGDKDPVYDAVWWLHVCPVCGVKVLTPPYTIIAHRSSIHEDHETLFVVDSKNVTWKEARELANINDVCGLSIVTNTFIGSTTKGAPMSVSHLIKMLDALNDVRLVGADNLMSKNTRNSLSKSEAAETFGRLKIWA